MTAERRRARLSSDSRCTRVPHDPLFQGAPGCDPRIRFRGRSVPGGEGGSDRGAPGLEKTRKGPSHEAIDRQSLARSQRWEHSGSRWQNDASPRFEGAGLLRSPCSSVWPRFSRLGFSLATALSPGARLDLGAWFLGFPVLMRGPLRGLVFGFLAPVAAALSRGYSRLKRVPSRDRSRTRRSSGRGGARPRPFRRRGRSGPHRGPRDVRAFSALVK
jgi:hypothetical protein